MRLKILGTEATLATSAGSASNFGNAKEVRLFHDAGGNATHLVTITNAAGTTVATFSMAPSDSIVISKEPTQKIFASNDDIRAVAVSYIS